MYGIYANIWGIFMVNVTPYMAYIRILWVRDSHPVIWIDKTRNDKPASWLKITYSGMLLHQTAWNSTFSPQSIHHFEKTNMRWVSLKLNAAKSTGAYFCPELNAIFMGYHHFQSNPSLELWREIPGLSQWEPHRIEITMYISIYKPLKNMYFRPQLWVAQHIVTHHARRKEKMTASITHQQVLHSLKAEQGPASTCKIGF